MIRLKKKEKKREKKEKKKEKKREKKNYFEKFISCSFEPFNNFLQ